MCKQKQSDVEIFLATVDVEDRTMTTAAGVVFSDASVIPDVIMFHVFDT